MYTAVLIRRHINQITETKPFSIRNFLNYGSRNAVDQVFYRLVKSGYIIRIARGIFIKHNFPIPSALETATVKASAFGKTIAMHGSQAIKKLGLEQNLTEECTSNYLRNDVKECIYACSGSSSSFRFGKMHIRFLSTSARKMSLANTSAGITIRALCYLGKTLCNPQIIRHSILSFNRTDREMLRQSMQLMPAWLTDYFFLVIGGPGLRAPTIK